jgi:hypothetical protein
MRSGIESQQMTPSRLSTTFRLKCNLLLKKADAIVVLDRNAKPKALHPFVEAASLPAIREYPHAMRRFIDVLTTAFHWPTS